ncbi:MAG: outer membrane protein assembly factor BamA [Nitrospirae bacterium]|nr:outer membrane protein assembly factor BamA [Nitrospirota bacterium]
MNRKINNKRFGQLYAIVLFLASFLSFPQILFSEPIDGKTINSIKVKGLTRMNNDEFVDMLCFHAGEPYDAGLMARCIKRVFQKRIFANIAVDALPAGSGVELVYAVTELPAVKKINISGNNEISKRLIKKHLKFEKGDDFREEMLHKCEKDITELYRKKGFHDARVKISFIISGESGISINVDIDEGKPLIIKGINMPDDALKRVNIYANDIYDTEKIDKELLGLKEYYLKQGHIRPEIGPYGLNDGVFSITVNPGPKLEVKFSGNSAISGKKLSKELPFRDSEMVSDELIEEASRRIRDLYVESGYYYVQVAAGLETSEELIKVTFVIFEGVKVTLGKIDFHGAGIDPSVIKGIIPLKEGAAYNEGHLAKSIESVESFYNALGYLGMKVVNVSKEFTPDGGVINLVFEIQEGSQIKITGIEIEGNRDIPATEIRKAVNLGTDIPFNTVDISDARYRVLSLYKRYGYIDASVDVRSEIRDNRAILRFNVTEQSPSVLGKVIIRGNQKTKDEIISREFTLQEGDPYNHEEILNVKQRLYKLGLFNEVSIVGETAGKTEDKIVKDVIVTLEEDEPGSVELSAGYGEYEQFRGAIDLSYSNLGGYDRQLRFRGEGSSVEKRFSIDFTEPRLFKKRDLPFNASFIKENRKNVNIDTRDILFEIDKFSFIAGIEKELFKGLMANLSYEYSLNETRNVEPGVVLGVEDTGTVSIGSILASLFYDTRNDPFDPASGAINGIVLKFASETFLSEVEFIKCTLQSSWFFSLRKGLVFATSLRGGASYSFEEDDELPLVERFFLGGRTTARGYSHDTLGPKGSDDVPTGGNLFALINEELRISAGKGIGFVFFLDGGNVWQAADDVNSRLKFTVGGGLRYMTPVGPVRIDYGHKLDREEHESPGEIHFSFGHAF